MWGSRHYFRSNFCSDGWTGPTGMARGASQQHLEFECEGWSGAPPKSTAPCTLFCATRQTGPAIVICWHAAQPAEQELWCSFAPPQTELCGTVGGNPHAVSQPNRSKTISKVVTCFLKSLQEGCNVFFLSRKGLWIWFSLFFLFSFAQKPDSPLFKFQKPGYFANQGASIYLVEDR